MAGNEPLRVDHWIDDPLADGAWNMAFDQFLMEQCEQTGQSFLRFYRWTPATLSLGYFQSYHDRSRHVASLGVPVVRRTTGGGAIVHDIELTYSLVIPNRERWSRAHEDLVEYVHRLLIVAIQQRTGLTLGFSRDLGQKQLMSDEEPFLCFLRRHPLDVVSNQHKLVGSAQRRSRGALLQHGSILIGRSLFAPELPGVLELCGQRFDAELLVQELKQEVLRAVGLEGTAAMAVNVERVKQIAASRFGHSDWTLRR